MMTDPAPPPARRRRWQRILLVQMVLWPVAAVALDVAYRVYLSKAKAAYSADEALETIESTLANVDAFVPDLQGEVTEADLLQRRKARVIHPFTGYDFTGGLDLMNVEVRALRSKKHAADLEILIVGGSVSQMFCQYGTTALTEVLRRDARFANQPFHYLRFGRGGYKQPQQLHMFTYLLSMGFEPEVVILIDGFNEVVLANQNVKIHKSHPAYPSTAHWGHLVRTGGPDDQSLALLFEIHERRAEIRSLCERIQDWPVLLQSSILGRRALERIFELQRQGVELQGKYNQYVSKKSEFVVNGPDWNRDAKEPLNESVAVWAESARLMNEVCKARGIAFLHVLQPTLWDEGAKPITEEERKVGATSGVWLDGVRRGYPLLRRVGAMLAAEGLPFVDGSMFFAGIEETLYIDACHVEHEGNRILAEKIGAALLERWPATSDPSAPSENR